MPRWLALLLLAAQAAAADEAPMQLRWLGVAGFSLTAGDTTLLHDPYLSRPSLWTTATSWYRPDPAVLAPLLAPGSRAPELAQASLILIGHSHFDHLGDAPWIAGETGARVAGSQTTVSIARAYGLAAERALRADPGATLSEGPFSVRVIESRHARVILGRVPLECTLEEPPEAPIHALSFCLGDARLYLVTHQPSGVRVLLTSSADVHPPALAALRAEGVSVDVLLAATQGRDPGYARALVAAVRPRLAIPHHYESFFEPLDSPDAATPSDPDDLAAFERELAAAAEAEGVAMQVRRLGLFEAISLPETAVADTGD
jgi:L-ascorbate metabolism protein UlaG (beta-lactamase superfamily)